jgi:hypothetical protein
VAKKDQIIIHTSISAYLRRMAATRALNFIRDNKKYNWDELETPDGGLPTLQSRQKSF